MYDMWFFMPEIAEKSARIMVGSVLPGGRCPTRYGDGRASDGADRPGLCECNDQAMTTESTFVKTRPSPPR
ncbi:MAG: hypothetical protein Kow0010_09160 [Dehalococcoidia bacterium]